MQQFCTGGTDISDSQRTASCDLCQRQWSSHRWNTPLAWTYAIWDTPSVSNQGDRWRQQEEDWKQEVCSMLARSIACIMVTPTESLRRHTEPTDPISSTGGPRQLHPVSRADSRNFSKNISQEKQNTGMLKRICCNNVSRNNPEPTKCHKMTGADYFMKMSQVGFRCWFGPSGLKKNKKVVIIE